MKKIWIILAIILCVSNVNAKQYKLLDIRNPNTIDIGGRVHKVGDYFDDSETIHWDSDKQYIAIQGVEDRRTRYLTGASMRSTNAKNIKDYVIRMGKLSGKDGESWLTLAAKNTDDYTDKRIALVIGNSNYLNNTPLRNPGNDATAVGNQLQQLGFDVIIMYDASFQQMEYVMDEFRQKAVKGLYDFALFYFSGHGLQYDSQDWLLPVDVQLEHPSDLSNQCIGGQTLLSAVAGTECTNTVVILDACRTDKINWVDESGNPIPAKASVSVNMDPRDGMLLAYSTKSGNISNDVTENNDGTGPYATALVNNLKIKNLKLNDLFDKVKRQVMDMTSSTQIPIYTNSANNDTMYINGKNVVVPKSAVGDAGYNSTVYMGYIVGKANQGDSEAQFQLGKCYENGWNGLHKDYATAVQWYQKAAKQGHAEAQNKVGTDCLLNENYKEAMKWYESAVKAGSLNARYNMGMMYMNKKYGMYNVDKGFACYKLAAEAGHARAQFELGLCYYSGIGTVKYRTQAVVWFERSAKQGYDEAQYVVGMCYLTGDGVEKNYKTAFNYFKMAAEQDYAPAQFSVCECFEKGYGVESNLMQAIEWCQKAANQGYEKATRKLQLLQP